MHNSSIVYSKEYVKTEFKIGDLKVQGAILYMLDIPLSNVFTISLGSQDRYRGIIVELRTEKDFGFGEGATEHRITGEIPEAIFYNSMFILKTFNGKNFESIEDFESNVDSSMYAGSVSKNAISIAIHDLIAKVYGVHSSILLGGSHEERVTSLTIPIGSVENNLKVLKDYQKKGARIIKIKVGKDAEIDKKRITAIADNLNKGERFYADANQGYGFKDAVEIGSLLSEKGALFFEQPMNRNDLRKLRDLRKKVNIPIALDESISSPYDVLNAIMYEAADIVNVKLTKSGGIRNAFKSLAVAQAYGIDGMVGCMVESKLGISAGLALANSLKNVKYVDLDGFMDLTFQPFEKGVLYKEGKIAPEKGTGFATLKNF